MPRKKLVVLTSLLLLLGATSRSQAQDQQQPSAPQEPKARRRGPDDGTAPLTGKITALKNGTLELSTPEGATVTVKLTDKTEFRKNRQPASPNDFKVSDTIFVRGEQNADHSVTAAVIASRTGGGEPGAGRRFGGGAPLGELGKDFVAGEVKSVDAPRLTVLRSDNVTQTIELNEETSLRKGRDSVTMADIQPGDHVFARGALQNNVFTSKSVIILSEEQWKRMQEMGTRRHGPAEKGADDPPPGLPPAAPPQK